GEQDRDANWRPAVLLGEEYEREASAATIPKILMSALPRRLMRALCSVACAPDGNVWLLLSVPHLKALRREAAQADASRRRWSKSHVSPPAPVLSVRID